MTFKCYYSLTHKNLGLFILCIKMWDDSTDAQNTKKKKNQRGKFNIYSCKVWTKQCTQRK